MFANAAICGQNATLLIISIVDQRARLTEPGRGCLIQILAFDADGSAKQGEKADIFDEGRKFVDRGINAGHETSGHTELFQQGKRV